VETASVQFHPGDQLIINNMHQGLGAQHTHTRTHTPNTVLGDELYALKYNEAQIYIAK
jgi:hypothetical protein